MKVWISKMLFKLYGWKLTGEMPKDIRKYVLIAAPHTSNFDFFLALPTMWTLGVKGQFLIKREHTDAFYGGLIKKLGGIGVDRQNQTMEFVEQLQEIVRTHDELALLFTPEGTRKAVKKWKTGFYRVAKAANVPIILAYADYENKIVHIGDVYHPTWDFETDFKYFEDYYKDIAARYEENFNRTFFIRSKQ